MKTGPERGSIQHFPSRCPWQGRKPRTAHGASPLLIGVDSIPIPRPASDIRPVQDSPTHPGLAGLPHWIDAPDATLGESRRLGVLWRTDPRHPHTGRIAWCRCKRLFRETDSGGPRPNG